VTGDAQSTKPAIDSVPVPLLSSSQWAKVPDAWINGVLEAKE